MACNRRKREGVHWVLRYITYICRILGAVAGGIIWWTCIEIIYSENIPEVAKYMILIAVVYTIIEVLWLLDKFVCCEDRGCICCFFNCLVWMDSWRKTLIYTALSIPLFLPGLRIFLSIVEGGTLVCIGFCYLWMAFEHCECAQTQSRSDERMQIISEGQTETKAPEPPKDLTEESAN